MRGVGIRSLKHGIGRVGEVRHGLRIQSGVLGRFVVRVRRRWSSQVRARCLAFAVVRVLSGRRS